MKTLTLAEQRKQLEATRNALVKKRDKISKELEENGKAIRAIELKEWREKLVALMEIPEAVKYAYHLPSRDRDAKALNGVNGTVKSVDRLWATVMFGDREFNIRINHLIPVERDQGVIIEFGKPVEWPDKK